MAQFLILNKSGKSIALFMGNILSFETENDLSTKISHKTRQLLAKEFVPRIRASYQDKTILNIDKIINISVEHYASIKNLYKHIESQTWSKNSIDLQSEFLKGIDIASFLSPLEDVVEPMLRQKTIAKYYTKNILPLVSDKLIQYHNGCYFPVKQYNKGYGNRDFYRHINYAHRILTVVRPRILNEYSERSLFWARLNRNADNMHFLQENFNNSLGTTWFDNNYGFIDLFTDQAENAHMTSLLLGSDNIVFSANLTPLISQLKELDLLDKF